MPIGITCKIQCSNIQPFIVMNWLINQDKLISSTFSELSTLKQKMKLHNLKQLWKIQNILVLKQVDAVNILYLGPGNQTAERKGFPMESPMVQVSHLCCQLNGLNPCGDQWSVICDRNVSVLSQCCFMAHKFWATPMAKALLLIKKIPNSSFQCSHNIYFISADSPNSVVKYGTLFTVEYCLGCLCYASADVKQTCYMVLRGLCSPLLKGCFM